VKKVNVLFVMFQMGMGGSERLVHDLILRLDRSIFNASVAWRGGWRGAGGWRASAVTSARSAALGASTPC